MPADPSFPREAKRLSVLCGVGGMFASHAANNDDGRSVGAAAAVAAVGEPLGAHARARLALLRRRDHPQRRHKRRTPHASGALCSTSSALCGQHLSPQSRWRTNRKDAELCWEVSWVVRAACVCKRCFSKRCLSFRSSSPGGFGVYVGEDGTAALEGMCVAGGACCEEAHTGAAGAACGEAYAATTIVIS